MKAKLPKMFTEAYIDDLIMRLDMLALLVLHNEFGFGADRLRRYYHGIWKLADYYNKFKDGEPEYGRRTKNGFDSMELYKLRKDLLDIGFDYEAEINAGEEKIKGDLKK